MDSIEIEVLTPKSLGYSFEVSELATFFRKVYSRNENPIILKAKSISEDSINFFPFRAGIDLWKTTRNTISGHIPCVNINYTSHNDLLNLMKSKLNEIDFTSFSDYAEIRSEIENVICDSFNTYFANSLIVDFKIPDDNELLKKLNSKDSRFPGELSSDLLPSFHLNFHWTLLIESGVDQRKIEALIEYYRKLDFVNSKEAIDQTIDRKLYLEKAVNAYLETF
jgi:hypothetical protein